MKKINVVICVFLFLGISTQAQLTVSTHVNTEVICHGGSNGNITATPSGGTSPYTYSWSPGSQTTATIGGLTVGTYTIHVTDHASLTASATATITQPAALTIALTATYTAVCPGKSDSLFATVSGGTTPYTYSWTAPFGDISNPSAARVNSYPYGSPYSFAGSEVVDKMGCSNTASINITVYPFPYVTVYGAISPIAPGRSDTLVASAVGATYLWSNSSTTSSIIVSPSISTTYTVKAKNTYGCYDTARYTIDTERVGNGTSSSNAIPVVQNSTVSLSSFSNYSTYDSIVWFSFVAQDSNAQIIANSAFLGMPVPHVHRLTLYNGSLNTVVDENMPDITGANQIRIDISHLKIDSTYYVRASETPAHSNMPGCNPNSAGECNPSQRWSFQMCFRTLNIFVPNDSGSEAPSTNQLFYEGRGQIADMNDIPRFDIKSYTNYASPAVYSSDSALSFVYKDADSIQRVDMVLTGSAIQAPQPVFKMEEDSNAGFLTYFKEFTYNAVPKIEGYSRLVYKNVYPNVDAQVYSNSVGTKLYFVCNPASGTGGSAGNPANIELKFNGANSVTINSDSGISVATNFGTLSFAPGYAYEDSAGIIKPKSWHANFERVNSTTVKFHTSTYNTNEPLIIQVDRGHPSLTSFSSIGNLDWCTYMGGTNAGDNGEFAAVAHDDSGNVYTVGTTNSVKFPVYIGLYYLLQDTLGGDSDAVVVKFNSEYKRIWACYYGGSGNEVARGIGVYNNASNPSDDNIIIAGSTNSTNLPKTGNGFQHYLNGTNLGPNTDVFIAMIWSSGFNVTFSTYYGGKDSESAHFLAVDQSNSTVYVVGTGDSLTHTVHKPDAYNSQKGGALIMRFTINASAGTIDTVWTTLVGSDSSGYNGCAVDIYHNLYVTGSSNRHYPITSGTSFEGGLYDAIVTKFNPLDTIVWSTYVGGTLKDVGNAITTDLNANVWVTGHSYSAGLPGQIVPTHSWSYLQDTNGNFYSPHHVVSGNAFIVGFAPSSGTLPNQIYGTFFGGVGDVDGAAITTDFNNNIYITGSVENRDTAFVWPTPEPAGTYVMRDHPNGMSDETFIAAFNPDQGYYWGTILDTLSLNSSAGYGITAFGNNQLYVVGTSSFYPYQFVNPGGQSWFQNAYGSASSIPFASEFNISTITTKISSLHETTAGEVNVYPNPTTNNVTVQLNIAQSGNVEFVLYNLFGVAVYSENINEPKGMVNKQISLTTLSSGTYILQARTSNSIYYAKITKLQ